eukprot:6176305-Pleurochrysis_carterae.AAC.5
MTCKWGHPVATLPSDEGDQTSLLVGHELCRSTAAPPNRKRGAVYPTLTMGLKVLRRDYRRGKPYHPNITLPLYCRASPLVLQLEFATTTAARIVSVVCGKGVSL